MKARTLMALTAALLASRVFTGCGTDGGSTSVHAGFSYGVGYYDPWYYGPGYYPPDVIVTPPEPGQPPDRPHPEHPIAKPPEARPTPRPAPSIPSAPRPMGRVGGRR